MASHEEERPSRRAFLTAALAASALAGAGATDSAPASAAEASLGRPAGGDWPMSRHDVTMTGYQPLPGAMPHAPRILAKHFVGASQGVPIFADLRGTGAKQEILLPARAQLTAYDAHGKRLWQAAPAGCVIESVAWIDDLDGDGQNEVVALAATVGGPRKAYVVLNARTGALRATLPFLTGDFGYFGQCGAYLPGVPGKQIFLVTSTLQSASGPYRSNGQWSLWRLDRDPKSQILSPKSVWAFIPGEFGLLYPDVLIGDLGSGSPHAVVNSWGHVWNIDLATGEHTHTVWDVLGTNRRHYGWNQLIDVDGDGKLDYVSLTSTKRVDVLLNRGGRLEHAWTHGWPDTVTTEARSLVRPSDPVCDLDGDGKMEVCAAVFDGLTDKRWHLFIWDAVTGTQKAEAADLVPIASVPLWGAKGPRALLCARSAKIAYDQPEAYEAWQLHDGTLSKLWSAADVTLLLESIDRSDTLIPNTTGTNVRRLQQADVDGDGRAEFFTLSAEGTTPQVWGLDANGRVTAKSGKPPAPPASPTLPPHLPALIGATIPYLSAADVDGDGRNEVLLFDNATVSVARVQQKKLHVLETIPSTEIPIVCDLLGDGTPCLLTAGRGTDGNLWVQARGKDRKTLWRTVFPNSGACGQYSSRPLYFTVGRFTGRKGWDVFAYSTKPEARSYVLDGQTGQPVWERRDLPEIERSVQPFGGRAGVWDYSGDDSDDIFLCNPDYYCVVNGTTGELLVGPVSIAQLTTLWAAYASPVVLPRSGDSPLVYLGGAYSSRLSIRPDGAQCLWHEYLPTERWPLGNREPISEGILPPTQGRGWRIGQVEADGSLICFEAATGRHLWTLALPTATSGFVTGDVDGDGQPEFVFGGVDGNLTVVRDDGERTEVVWRRKFEAPVGTPILADVNADGKSEIIVSVGDGFVYVLS